MWTYRQTDRQTDRHIGRQMNKQASWLRYMQLIGTYLEIVFVDVPQTICCVTCILVFSSGLVWNCNSSLWWPVFFYGSELQSLISWGSLQTLYHIFQFALSVRCEYICTRQEVHHDVCDVLVPIFATFRDGYVPFGHLTTVWL
jgi:hypothetical protein